MRFWNTYYLVDFLTNSIVTSFEAISDSMAFAVLRKLIESNKGLKSIDSCYSLIKHGGRYVADSVSDISPSALDNVNDNLLVEFGEKPVLSEGFINVALPTDIVDELKVSV